MGNKIFLEWKPLLFEPRGESSAPYSQSSTKKSRKYKRRSYLRQRFYSINVFAKHHTTWQNVACMTGALSARRGEHDISHEARDQGKRKIQLYFCLPFVSRFELVSCSAWNSASAFLAHKAPVMQARQNVASTINSNAQAKGKFQVWRDLQK